MTLVRIEDTPYILYRDDRPAVQQRLIRRALFIHRDTAYPADVQFARDAIGHALYWHMDVVMLEAWWADLPATLKRWCRRHGVRVILCQSFDQARNSADVKWTGEAAK